MASITSVISFFILLLATYSYSAPVGQEYDYTTPPYEFTTGTTIVEHGSPAELQLLSDAESTGVPQVQQKRLTPDESSEEFTTSSSVTMSERSLEETYGEEFTTSGDVTVASRSFEESYGVEATTSSDVPVASRQFEEYSYISTTPESSDTVETNDKRNFDEYSYTSTTPESSDTVETNDKRTFDEYSATTMESSTQFNRRAIKPVEFPEEVEVTTPFPSENPMEMTTSFEPLSSGDSFGKSIDLLENDRPEEQTSTSEYRELVQSNEGSVIRVSAGNGQDEQTISIYPGKITETKIFEKLPAETPDIRKTVEKRQFPGDLTRPRPVPRPLEESPVPSGESPVPSGELPVPSGESPVPPQELPVPPRESPVSPPESPVPSALRPGEEVGK